MGIFNDFETKTYEKTFENKMTTLGLSEEEIIKLKNQLEDKAKTKDTKDILQNIIKLSDKYSNPRFFLEAAIDYTSNKIGDDLGDAATSLNIYDNKDNLLNIYDILDERNADVSSVMNYLLDAADTPSNAYDYVKSFDRLTNEDKINVIKECINLKDVNNLSSAEKKEFSDFSDTLISLSDIYDGLGYSKKDKEDCIIKFMNENKIKKNFFKDLNYDNISNDAFNTSLNIMNQVEGFEDNSNLQSIYKNKKTLKDLYGFLNENNFDKKAVRDYMKDILKGEYSFDEVIENTKEMMINDKSYTKDWSLNKSMELGNIIKDSNINTNDISFDEFNYKASEEEIDNYQNDIANTARQIANNDINIYEFGGGHNGMSNNHRYDSSGFINEVLKESDIDVPDMITDTMEYTLLNHGFTSEEYTDVESLKVGDILILGEGEHQFPAVYVGNGNIAGAWGINSYSEQDSISIKNLSSKATPSKVLRFDGENSIENKLSNSKSNNTSLSELASTVPQEYIEALQDDIAKGNDISKYSIKDINNALNKSGAEKDAFSNYINSIPEDLREDVIKDLIPHAGFDYETQILNFFNEDFLNGYYQEEVMDDSLDNKIRNYKDTSEKSTDTKEISKDEVERDD